MAQPRADTERTAVPISAILTLCSASFPFPGGYLDIGRDVRPRWLVVLDRSKHEAVEAAGPGTTTWSILCS